MTFLNILLILSFALALYSCTVFVLLLAQQINHVFMGLLNPKVDYCPFFYEQF